MFIWIQSSTSAPYNNNMIVPFAFSEIRQTEHFQKTATWMAENTDLSFVLLLGGLNSEPTKSMKAREGYHSGIVCLNSDFSSLGIASGEAFLKADFNKLEDLRQLADMFQGKFICIAFDWSTSKYAQFSEEHIQCFKSMLKVGGEFIYEISNEWRPIKETPEDKKNREDSLISKKSPTLTKVFGNAVVDKQYTYLSHVRPTHPKDSPTSIVVVCTNQVCEASD